MTGADHGEISVRLVRKIRFDEDGCWIWTGRLNRDGYGQISMDGRQTSAHIAAYLTFEGQIPKGLQLDHLCRNRACCNPGHLEPVTPRINTLRGETFAAANAVKTHCKRGHEFTPANTLRVARGRACRACNVLHSRAYYARKKQASGSKARRP